MASEKVQQLNDADFDNAIKSDQPTLVDFWAPWCGPCKAIGPVVEELADEYEGKVTIAKMNVDDNPVVPGKFGIRAVMGKGGMGPKTLAGLKEHGAVYLANRGGCERIGVDGSKVSLVIVPQFST